MLRFSKTLVWCALSACSLSTASKRGQATGWAIVNGAVCAPDGGALVVKASNLATLYDNTGAVRLPTMQLVLGASASSVTPTYDAASGTFSVSIPSSTPIGYYDLLITRASDGAQEKISGALQVLGPPTITAITGQAACASSSEQTFSITGTNLGPHTLVTLQGDSAPLASSADSSGSSLKATAPIAGHSAGPYAITISNGGHSCIVTSDASVGFVVKLRPTVSQTLSGPHLRSGALPTTAPVTVRVTGTNLSAGTLVSIGSVAAASVAPMSGDTSGTSVDATFASGSLAAGTQAVSIANGACVVPAPGQAVRVAAPDMSVSRLSPTGWVSGAQGVFFDAYGALTSAGTAPALWIDTDASVFTEQWHKVALFAALDASGHAYRFANASGASVSVTSTSGAANVAITSGDQVHEAFVAGALSLSAQPAPRLVWKDKEWVNANGVSTQDSLTVYGCHLAGASFKLLGKNADGSWADLDNGALSVSASPGAAWGAAKFKCTDGTASADKAEEAVTLTTSASLAAGGPYRIRAFVPASPGVPEVDADDLYPLTAYDTASLTLTASSTQVPPLLHARKNPNTLSAPDATGRKYLYVIGGAANVATTDPSDGGGDASYEFSPLDPDHGLVGWAKNPSDATKPFDLTGSDSTATYGMAAATDGPFIYLAGGTSNSSAAGVASVRQTQVLDPTDPANFAGATPALPPQGRLDALVTKRYLCTGSGCPLAPATTTALYGAKAALIGGATAARSLVVFGGYSGADTLSGAEDSNLFYSIPVDAQGLSGLLAAVDDKTPTHLSPQAPQTLVWRPTDASSGTLYAVLGVLDNTNESQKTQAIDVTAVSGPCASNCKCDTSWQYCAHATINVSGTGLNPSTCDANQSSCSETGFASVAIGGSLFMLGGTARSSEASAGNWTSPSFPRSESLFMTLPTGAVSNAAFPNLGMRRTLAGSAFVPPFEFIAAGVECKEDNGEPSKTPCNGAESFRVAEPTIETLELN